MSDSLTYKSTNMLIVPESLVALTVMTVPTEVQSWTDKEHCKL